MLGLLWRVIKECPQTNKQVSQEAIQTLKDLLTNKMKYARERFIFKCLKHLRKNHLFKECLSILSHILLGANFSNNNTNLDNANDATLPIINTGSSNDNDININNSSYNNNKNVNINIYPIYRGNQQSAWTSK